MLAIKYHHLTMVSILIFNNWQLQQCSITDFKYVTDTHLTKISECVVRIADKYFENPVLVTYDKNTRDIADIILARLNFTVRFSSGFSEHIRPENYIIIISSNDIYQNILNQMRRYSDWNSQAKFVVVSLDGSFNNQMWFIKNLIKHTWRALISNFILINYAPLFKRIYLYRHSYFDYSSKCGTVIKPEYLGNCHANDSLANFFNDTEDIRHLQQCPFNILTVRCAPIAIDATKRYHRGMAVTFVRRIARTCNLNFVYQPTQVRQIMSAELITWLKEELVGLQNLGFITCCALAGTDNTDEFFPSYYLMEDQLIWVVPSLPPYAHWKNVAFAFSGTSWILIIVGGLFIPVLFTWLCFRKWIGRSLIHLFVNHVQIYLGQSTAYNPKRIILRVLFMACIISSIHLNSAFQGRLMSLLTHQLPRQQMDIKDLSKSKLPLVVQKFIYKEMSPLLKNQTTISSNKELSSDLLDMLKTRDSGTVVTKLTYLYYLNRTIDLNTGLPLINTFEQDFLSYYLYILFQKGHPLINEINRCILQLHQNGISRQTIQLMEHYYVEMNNQPPAFNQQRTLTFEHLEVAFIFLGIGLMVSVVVLFSEIIWSIERNRYFDGL